MIPDRIAPITFEAPPADHGCAGKWRPFKACFVALCHSCDRFCKGGPQIDPVARIVHGGSVCPNLVPIAHVGLDHEPANTGLTSHDSYDPKEGQKAPISGFRNAGVTARGVAK